MWEEIIINRVEIENKDQRRSRMDVISGMLQAATNGAKKTRIMYKAALNFKQMQKYLPLLLKRGLLENVKTDKGVFYKTTEKGLAFLKKYEELNNI